jgi:hypothetical protein
MLKTLRRLTALAGVVLASAVIGLPAAALAQSTYTLTRSFSGSGGLTGSAVLVLDNSTLAPGQYGDISTVTPSLISATLTFNNLGSTPTTTTFTKADMVGFILRRDSSGELYDVNFRAAPNSDGYTLDGVGAFTSEIRKSSYSVLAVNAAPPAPTIPTLGEWAMILFGTVLAGAAALYVQRRRLAV